MIINVLQNIMKEWFIIYEEYESNFMSITIYICTSFIETVLSFFLFGNLFS
jgi:hypothetical protein